MLVNNIVQYIACDDKEFNYCLLSMPEIACESIFLVALNLKFCFECFFCILLSFPASKIEIFAGMPVDSNTPSLLNCKFNRLGYVWSCFCIL